MNRAARNQGVTGLGDLAQLSVSVELPGDKHIREALKETGLRLPAGGEYVVRLDGRELHVYEVKQGIGRYDFRDWKEVEGTSVESGEIAIDVSGRFASRIILHIEAQRRPHTAALLDELDVPADLLQEYAQLRAKPALTAAELDRKREVLSELRKAFSVPEKSKVKRVRSSSIRPTGESATGISSSG